MAVVARRTVAKFRYNSAIPIAGLILLFAALPVAASAWYLAFVELVPVAIVLWGWLAGVDVRGRELVVRYPVGRRRLALDDVRGLTVTRRRIAAVRPDDSSLWLPGVTPAALPKLAAACGFRVPGSESPASTEENAPEPAEKPDESGEPVSGAGRTGGRDSAG
jgi:PH (Pleckstrin Homology) domain-containing protein